MTMQDRNISASDKAKSYGTLEVSDRNGERVWIVSDLPPHVSLRFKKMFQGISEASVPPFTLKDRNDRATDLAWFMTRYPLEMNSETRACLEHAQDIYAQDMRSIEAIQSPDYTPRLDAGFREGESPLPYQARAAELFRNTRRLLLLDDVGLGKTVSALASLSDGWGLPALVVVQPHLSEQWVKKYIQRFTHLSAHEITDRSARELPPADIYVARYSNVAAWTDVLVQAGIKTLVLDEVQEVRHGQSTVKGAAIRILSREIENIIGLSATPIHNYGGEIFEIIETIAPGALGTWHEFVINWCSQQGGHWIVKDPAALGSFLQEEGIALRRTSNDPEVAASLPPLTKNVFEVDWNEGDAEDDRELQRKLAQRVVSGGFFERGQAARELDMLVRQETGIAKARSVAAYVRMLVDAGEPVVVGAWHREVYRIYLEALEDLSPRMFTGTETAKQKAAARDAFINGETDILIMSLRSGAGLDGLQHRASHVVLGELDWSPAVHTQFIGRLHRTGQERPVMAHFLHTNGGADPVMLAALGLKSSQAHGILNPYDTSGGPGTELDESRMKTLAKYILDTTRPGPKLASEKA